MPGFATPRLRELLLFLLTSGMLAALDLRFVARLVVAGVVFLLGFLTATPLIMLSAGGLIAALLSVLRGVLAALDRGIMAGLLMGTSVVFGCHRLLRDVDSGECFVRFRSVTQR